MNWIKANRKQVPPGRWCRVKYRYIGEEVIHPGIFVTRCAVDTDSAAVLWHEINANGTIFGAFHGVTSYAFIDEDE